MKGAAGDSGEVGVPGRVGPPGVAGTSGSVGSPGRRGQDGLPGLRGEQLFGPSFLLASVKVQGEWEGRGLRASEGGRDCRVLEVRLVHRAPPDCPVSTHLRRQELVSWRAPGSLQLSAGLGIARERCGLLPLRTQNPSVDASPLSQVRLAIDSDQGCSQPPETCGAPYKIKGMVWYCLSPKPNLDSALDSEVSNGAFEEEI